VNSTHLLNGFDDTTGAVANSALSRDGIGLQILQAYPKGADLTRFVRRCQQKELSFLFFFGYFLQETVSIKA